jgi:DNA-binding YbaB/EbfC family protein
MEPGGQFDFQQLLSAAAQMQSQLVSAQQKLAETEIEGTAGGGLVKVTINGQGELVDLTIAKDAIEPGDPEETASTVADLVLAACRDAYRALADAQEEAMGPLAGAFGGGGGSGVPGLPGFPGLPGLTDFPGSPSGPPVPGTIEAGEAEPGAEPGQR